MAAEASVASIEVRVPTILHPHVGGASSVTSGGRTLRELVAGIVDRYPGLRGQLVTETGDLHRFVNVYRNDDDVRDVGGLYAELSPGDIVSIIPAVAGG